MKCPKCGTENAPLEIFCQNCAEKLVPKLQGEISTLNTQLKHGEIFIKNRFKVIKRLGKGGMGEVFLAEDIKLRRNVAIKSILTDNLNLSDLALRNRLLREAQTASQLDHPNICTVYEIYEEEHQSFIVMQYVDGITVDQIIKLKPLGIKRTLDIAIQLCNGMIEAHEIGITHRDIKPGNIIVDKKGVVKILDFGLAKLGKETNAMFDEGEATDLTEKGFIMGTVSYLSPEQASGKSADYQTDIFSSGILIYEMLEGKNPFKEDEHIETLYNILNKKVEFTKELPEELKAIILKALEKDKKNRYSSFIEMKKALEHFRLNYVNAKEQQAVNDRMEKTVKRKGINPQEVPKSSDNVGLGELVNKIKKYKASTEKVNPLEDNKHWLHRLALLVIIISLLLAGFFIINYISKQRNSTGEPLFFVYLQPFENNTPENNPRENNLAEMLNYLLTESLDQFNEFKVIDHETIGNFKAKYKLTGKISVLNDLYTVEGFLLPLDKSQKEKRFTITGKDKDSIIGNQVDNLTKRIYTSFFPTESFQKFAFKKMTDIFGSNWQTFADFYQGNYYKKRLEANKAKQYLFRAYDLLITKYVLADLFYFEGNRNKALKLVNEIIPQINLFTEAMSNRVLALKARLDFDFEKEIENLEKLKNNFPFSQEVFYEMGNAYFHHGNPENALKCYQNALDLNQDYSIVLNRTGYCYTYLGNHVKAIEAFEEYNRLDQSANSFDSLGDGYFYAGEMNSAVGMKERAISTDEKSVPWAYETLADIEILKARYQEAEKKLAKYEQIQQTNIDKTIVLNKLAYIDYLNKDYKNAKIKINESLAIFDSAETGDNSAEAHWLKGIILFASGASEESKLELDWLRNFKIKYKLTSENFLAPLKYFLHLEALFLEHNQNTVDAEKNFKLLINMKPQLSYWITYYHYQFFHTEYTAFLMRMRRDREALVEIDQCLEFNANYIPALWLKADILEKMGDPQRWVVYNKIAELYGESTEKNYLRNLLKEKLK